METVKIYHGRIFENPEAMYLNGETVSLIPLVSDGGGWITDSDGGKDYILPDGYYVSESNCSEKMIFSAKNEACALSWRGTHPCLSTSRETVHLHIDKI